MGDKSFRRFWSTKHTSWHKHMLAHLPNIGIIKTSWDIATSTLKKSCLTVLKSSFRVYWFVRVKEEQQLTTSLCCSKLYCDFPREIFALLHQVWNSGTRLCGRLCTSHSFSVWVFKKINVCVRVSAVFPCSLWRRLNNNERRPVICADE